MIKFLEHEFFLRNNHKYTYDCYFCKIAAFHGVHDMWYIQCPDIPSTNRFNKLLDLSCNEVIIKKLLE